MMKGLVAGLVLLAAATISPGRARAETQEQRLRRLEEALKAAQDEIKDLRSQMQQQRAIGQATQRQAEQADENAKTAAAQASKGVDIPDILRKTTIFGDVRYRHEGFYHQPHVEGTSAVTARNRERLRARLGLRFALSDEISATIRMASGNPDDPISPNETLTGNFNRKHVNLDWAYLTLTPGKSFNIRPGVFSVTAGKFGNPIFRVGEMVFDDDLSPEGLYETVQVLDKPVGALDQIKIHALQWTFDEVANNQDGWMFGGQINPTMHFGNTQVEAGLGQYWWLNSDLIAQSLDSTSPNFNKALANTNLLVKDGAKIVGYASSFNQTNLDAAVTFPNVVGTQPVRLFADYVYNWLAATDDAHGWMAGARLGQTKVRNDWSVYGFYEHIGQEAAISAFTYSDFGNGGTNQEGPVVGVDYQLLNPLTLSMRSHFTNFINRPTNTTNPTMTRLQLDAIVKF